MNPKRIHVAVRKTEGREWFDLDSVSVVSHEEAKKKAFSSGARCGPYWEKDNPVVRIAVATIVEDES
jgi:hypothetical protein